MTPEQIAELQKPLDPAAVRSRQQGRSSVDYIESWKAIDEANRIFGFDGWQSETVDMVQLGQSYENQNGNRVVNYRAKVKIIVLDENGVGCVYREGSGFGQGIDRDEGQAHESAIKEAESDARKRALMTFGNPFGLALYDKSRANVKAETITYDMGNALQAKLKECGMDKAKFLEVSKIEKLEQLPLAKFEGAMKWIENNA